ncbi:MAG TPA: BolA/IbaG family iron-sulfur metabolism protein [Thiomicrorhabdus sp.]|nr:BolA/IbaG family iron-sulfur metabolism protein [Thiomicrorhabdus sp.]
MSPDTIKAMIEAAIPDSQVETNGEECNFSITVTSKSFEGKPPIQRHRMVNDVFKAQFDSGELHALSIKTLVA